MYHNIYIYIVFLLVLLWILQQFTKPQKLLYVWLPCALLALPLVLRNAEFGVIDMLRYSSYYNDFEYTHSLSEAILHSNGKDVGYWGITYVFSALGFSYQQYVSIISIFIMAVWGWFVNRYSPNVILSSFILLGSGCYTFMFYGLRQALAFAFVLLCIDACYEKKMKKTIILYISAFLCHWSSVAIVPLLFIGRLRLNNVVFLGYLFALILMMIFSTQIGFLITFLFSDEYIDTYSSIGGLGGLAILYLLLLIMYFVVLKNRIAKSYKYSFFMHGFIILNMIQICSAYAYSFTRLNYFYAMSVMAVAVPMSLDDNNFKSVSNSSGNRLLYVFISLIIIILMVRLFFSFINGNHLQSYVFFWEEIW